MFKRENVQFCVGAAAGITVGLIVGKLLSPNSSYSHVRNVQAPIRQDINSIPKNDKLYGNKQECCSKSVIEYKDIKSKDSIILTPPIKPTLNNSKTNINSTIPLKNVSLNEISSTCEPVEVSEEIIKLSYKAGTYTINTHNEPNIKNVKEAKIHNFKLYNHENTFPSYLMPEENQQAFDKFVSLMDITEQSVNFINTEADTFTNNCKATFNDTDDSRISCDLEIDSTNYVDDSISFSNISKMAMCNTVLDTEQTGFLTSTLIDGESLYQSNEFNEYNLVSSTMNDISITF